MRSLVLRQPGTLLARAVAATGSLLLPVAPGDAPLAAPPGRARSYKRTAAEDLDVGGSVSAHTAAERCHVGSTTADVDEMLIKKKTGQGLMALTSRFPVELPGIEPGSYGIPSRLLRAQFAMPLLGSPGHAN